MTRAILFIAFLMLSARGASSQPTPHDLNKAVDKRHITAPAGTLPQASVDPRPIQLSIIDGTDIRFARVSTADGLSQTKVGQIVQDDQGFMWFGTQYGLNRYDGYTFKVFIHDPGNPNSLNGVYIRSLFKDRDGTLWVGCDQFVNKFDPATETITRYPVPFVSHISQDSAGMLWLATSTGLYGLDRATGQIRHYSHDPNDPSSLSANDITSSGEDKAGRFWVANTKGLDELDRRTGKVTLHIPLPGDSWRFSFYEDRFGMFWIFNLAGNALAVFDRNTNTLTRYAFYKGEPPASAFGIRAVLEDRNDTLWLATQSAGLLKFDREHRRFIRYRNNPADPESLPQDSVISLYSDREGNIWAGLGRMGLARFTTKPSPFKRVPHNPSSSNGTVEPFVGAIYEDSQGILWIGTPDALNRIDRKAGRYTSYRTSGPGVGSDVITIREDHSGNLWVGTYGHGLHRFDARTGQFKTYRHDPADPYSLSNDYVSRLLVDHNGTLWAATQDAVNRFDSTRERFTTYNLDPQKGLFYQELVEDREGTLWLGTDSSGLRRFDPATGRFTMYQPDMKRPGTLSDNRVNSVHFDASGTAWLGTQNGLNKFDPKTSTFTVYTRRDGLPGNAVGCVLEDDHGDLWMSTNNGVARFNPQSRTVKSYSTTDGLPGPDLTGWGACFKSPGGEMFFGGFSGATAFFPDKVVDASYTPPIVLTDFRLPGNPAESGSRFSLQRSLSYARSLILSHAQNVFSLSFAALSYSNSATNRYRYKLEGLERDWNEVGSDRRQATYTTLPAGKYTFRVQGATSGGAWSDPGVALSIEVLPPWWGTWWFRSACGIITLVSLWLAYYLRIRRIAWQFNVRLEERVGERTRIARELHDTLLQSFHGLMFRFQAARNMLPRCPEEAMQALDEALERTEQAVAEGRDAVRGLRASTVVTNELAQAVRALGNEMSREPASQNSAHGCAGFHVVVEGPPRDLHPILQDEIYAIAREAVRNAFRYAQARNIEADITYTESSFQLSIRDDGKGIDAGIVAEGRAGHYGVRGMRERAKRIGGKLDVWSRNGAGTEIELSIPGSIAYGASPVRTVFGLSRKKAAKS
jgi:ligand-binding sensor domain-containing protein/signal transduction histidine kinase